MLSATARKSKIVSRKCISVNSGEIEEVLNLLEWQDWPITVRKGVGIWKELVEHGWVKGGLEIGDVENLVGECNCRSGFRFFAYF